MQCTRVHHGHISISIEERFGCIICTFSVLRYRNKKKPSTLLTETHFVGLSFILSTEFYVFLVPIFFSLGLYLTLIRMLRSFYWFEMFEIKIIKTKQPKPLTRLCYRINSPSSWTSEDIKKLHWFEHREHIFWIWENRNDSYAVVATYFSFTVSLVNIQLR